MTNCSIKEAENLCLKAARGAGYSWGMAEELSFASGWLITRNLSDLSDVTSLLLMLQKQQFAKLTQDNALNTWKPLAHGTLCPLTTGTYLSDSAQNLFHEHLNLKRVSIPILLLPFLSNVSHNINTSLHVSWLDMEALVHVHQIEILSGEHNLHVASAQDISVQKTNQKPKNNAPFQTRIEFRQTIFDCLNAFAYKTYVPETEELKATGAGGEKVNDDE